jgi:GTP pyrophosphokinase
MALSEFTTQDYEIIEREYAVLREAAQKRCANQEELDIVHKAYEFANQAHKGIRRRSGEPYIIHPIQVATIVVTKIGLGYKSIVAALLHDVVEDTEYTTEDISNLFGEKVASLVDGLTKIKVVLDNDVKAQQKSVQAENFKRILLTLNDDVRVVLIKLADRLHNCRTIEYMPEYKRDKILSETMFIFIPLAHRLGLYEVKSEMEDIWLRYKEPEAFQKISARIDKNVIDKEAQIDEFIAPINEALVAAGFRFYIKKRVKTPYSIWKKMNKKGIPFDHP